MKCKIENVGIDLAWFHEHADELNVELCVWKHCYICGKPLYITLLQRGSNEDMIDFVNRCQKYIKENDVLADIIHSTKRHYGLTNEQIYLQNQIEVANSMGSKLIGKKFNI